MPVCVYMSVLCVSMCSLCMCICVCTCIHVCACQYACVSVSGSVSVSVSVSSAHMSRKSAAKWLSVVVQVLFRGS